MAKRSQPSSTNESSESTTTKRAKTVKTTFTKSPSKKSTNSEDPFPDYEHPTTEECQQVHKILRESNGPVPEFEHVQSEDDAQDLDPYEQEFADSILDAVIRTQLGLYTDAGGYQTSKEGLFETFGYGPQGFEAIRQASLESVSESLKHGGLPNVKAKRIKQLLDQVYQRNNAHKLDLEDIKQMDDHEAMKTLTGLHGVGPRAAADVFTYQLKRIYFAVDSHIEKICKSLGWIPEKANRDKAHKHLNARIPQHLKWDLQHLLTRHSRQCKACSAKKETQETCVLTELKI